MSSRPPCPCCGAAWYAMHFSWCVEPVEKRCDCGVLHCEESNLCPICQLEEEKRERSEQRAPAVNHRGGVA